MIFKRIELHAADHCTLSCVGCNHASPFLKKNLYDPDDYIHWLDTILENGHEFNTLAISGGEPFILGEKLNEFCKVLKKKYNCFIQIFTNAFWMTSEYSIEKYDGVLSHIDSLQLSFYPPYIKKIGFDKLKKLAEYIKLKYKIEVYSFQQEGVKNFGQVYFYEKPVKTNENLKCAVKDCTQLTKEGILYRCTYGHYLKTAIPSQGFKNSKDIFFDLRDIKTKNIETWYEKWPLDSCAYCGCGPDSLKSCTWESDPSIKDMNRSEYLEKISKLIGKKNMKNLNNKIFI